MTNDVRDRQRITIRLATCQHVRDLIRIGSESATSPRWSDTQYAALFEGEVTRASTLVLVAETKRSVPEGGREVVGFLIAGYLAPEWELENIVVAREARGLGIGTQLLEKFLDRARNAGGESAFLEVRESNIAARRLYEKLGFQQSGRRKSYYLNPMEDAILYAKEVGGHSTG